MGCCDTMLRYIVFLINFVFFLTAVGLIGIGAYIQINVKQCLEFLDSQYINTSIVLMIIGGVILVVAFFGCCGACTESHCMMYTYGTLLALILISLIGCAITIYIFKDDVEGIIEDNMKKGLTNYEQPEHDGVTQTWDLIQKEYKCCGITTYTDWANTPFAGTTGKVPDSCCIQSDDGSVTTNCGENPSKDTIYVEGCFAKFKGDIVSNVAVAVGIGSGIAVLMLLGIIIACCQARHMREKFNVV